MNDRIDYQCRSKELDTICLYDYIRYYRKKPIDANDKQDLQISGIPSAAEIADFSASRRGRPRSDRFLFEASHPQVSSHLNIKRTKPVVPVLLGPAVPRRDRDDTKERYYRCILTLFVPWRCVTNLCSINETWEKAFEVRRKNVNSDCEKIIENIQLFHECKKERDEHLAQVIEAVQTETVDYNICPCEVEDNNEEDTDALLDALENMDIENVPLAKGVRTDAEEFYFRKIVQNVDHAERFFHVKGRILAFKNGINFYFAG